MWREHGVNWQWSLAQYAEKLKIGGGKERIASLASDDDFRAAYTVPASEDAWLDTVADWHRRKSEIFKQLDRVGRDSRPSRREAAGARRHSPWLDAGGVLDLGLAVGAGGAART